MYFGVINFTSAKCATKKFNIDRDVEYKSSVGVDGFAVAQGRKLYCFNSKSEIWR